MQAKGVEILQTLLSLNYVALLYPIRSYSSNNNSFRSQVKIKKVMMTMVNFKIYWANGT